MIQLQTKTHQMFNGLAAGNIGDELMYIGFLNIIHPSVASTVEIWDSKTSVEQWLPGGQRYIPWDDDELCERCASEAGVVLLVGDTPVTEDLGVEWPLRALSKRLAFCHNNGIPVHAIGVGVDHLFTPEAIAIFTENFKPIATWTVRSENCRQSLLKLGVDDHKVVVAADLGWLYTPKTDHTEWALNLLADLGLKLDMPIIGVNVVNEVWGESSSVKESIALALDKLVVELSAQVIFICNETRGGDYFDSAAAQSIISTMKQKSVFLPNSYYHPDQMISILSKLTATISQRYHFTVESVLAGTVPISFEKGQKMATLLAELAVPPAGTMTCVDADSLYSQVKDAITRQGFWKEHLLAQRKRLEERAYRCSSFLDAEGIKKPAPCKIRILIPRFDTFGDIVLLEGFVSKLAQQSAEVEITLLVREGYDELAPLFPKGIKWRTTPAHPYRGVNETDVAEIQELCQQISQESWDLVLFTTYNRTWVEEILAAHLSASYKVAIGESKEPEHWVIETIEKLNLNPDCFFDRFVPVEENCLEVDKYQVLWANLFPSQDNLPLPRLLIPTESAQRANGILLRLGIGASPYFICAVAGIQNNTLKQWPGERFASVIRWVKQEYGLHPLIVGHVSEREVVESVADMLPEEIAASTWLGETGELHLLAGLLQTAQLYVGNDTGTMHIAAATGIPVVGIFGGGHFPRFLPVGSRSVGVVAELPCFGCGWVCLFDDAPCVRLVSVDDVKKAIKNVVEDKLDANMQSAKVKIGKEIYNSISSVKTKFKILKTELASCEIDRSMRLAVIKNQEQIFSEKLEACEADRAARLEVILRQEVEFSTKLEALEADHAERIAIMKRNQQIEHLPDLTDKLLIYPRDHPL